MEYLAAAYAAIWCILFVYIFSLKSRLSSVEKTVDMLEHKIGK